MITSIVIRPATCGAIWRGIVRAGRSRNAHRDGGDRQRDRQRYLAQHDQSPCVEAAFGFHGLDRGTRHLFPWLYSLAASLYLLWEMCGSHQSDRRLWVTAHRSISGLPSKQTKISCLNATQGMDAKYRPAALMPTDARCRNSGRAAPPGRAMLRRRRPRRSATAPPGSPTPYRRAGLLVEDRQAPPCRSAA